MGVQFGGKRRGTLSLAGLHCLDRAGQVSGVTGEERNRDLGGEGSLGGVDAGLGVLHRKRGVTSEPSGTSGDLTREALNAPPGKRLANGRGRRGRVLATRAGGGGRWGRLVMVGRGRRPGGRPWWGIGEAGLCWSGGWTRGCGPGGSGRKRREEADGADPLEDRGCRGRYRGRGRRRWGGGGGVVSVPVVGDTPVVAGPRLEEGKGGGRTGRLWRRRGRRRRGDLGAKGRGCHQVRDGGG